MRLVGYLNRNALPIFANATAYSELELLTSAHGHIDRKIPPSALLK